MFVCTVLYEYNFPSKYNFEKISVDVKKKTLVTGKRERKEGKEGRKSVLVAQLKSLV